MSLELVKFAFSAGELSPKLLGRTDLEKYDLGLSLSRNWFVDYQGGLTTRPGLIFLDHIKAYGSNIRLVPFKYAPDTANTYLLMFGDLYMRVIQEGAYALEAAKTISAITKANPGVVTSAAHGFNNGDWVKLVVTGMTQLNGRSLVVAGVTTNTFQLKDTFGNNVDTTAYTTFVAGTVARVYTLATSIPAANLDDLNFSQYRDLMRITSALFAPGELVRTDTTNWSLGFSNFGTSAVKPTGVSTVPKDVGTSGVAFAVTSVNGDGEESLSSTINLELATNDFTTEDGAVDISWNTAAGAKYYNVYASLLTAGASVTKGAQLGYIGRAYGTHLQDKNIVPDFTKTPPNFYNPFGDGRITDIDVTNGGSGNSKTATMVSVSGGAGAGFVGYPVVDDGGSITSVVIVDPGHDYVSPVVSFGSTGGGGRAATAVASAMTGNYPRLATIFQQRQLYAASENFPLTVWGSRPKQFNNFDTSNIVADNDSYEFELDSEDVSPIRHLKSVRGGLLVMTDGGIWLLSGGGQNDPVTPTNVLAQPNTYTGISKVPPISLDTDLLYIESKGQTARLLSFNDFARLYSGEDVSIFSNHFFSTDNYITEWAFASDPFKLVWARRQDGSMLALTAVKEQNVFAWTQHWTKGLFYRVVAVQEDVTDVVYCVVERFLNGAYVKTLEQFASRKFDFVEDSFCVDCGLSLGHTSPAASIGMVVAGTAVAISASAGIFAGGDVGKIIRASGGKMRITAYINSTHVTATLLRDFTVFLPEDDSGQPLAAGEGTWTMDAPITAISGLWHLEGETVQALVDGNVVNDLVVTNGGVTLPTAGTTVHIGLKYTCTAKTLPLTLPQPAIEGRTKRVMGTIPRVHETRGLKAGASLDKLYPMRERMVEIPGEPNDPTTGVKTILHQSMWSADGVFYYVQEDPLPATILNFVASTEVGDDPE